MFDVAASIAVSAETPARAGGTGRRANIPGGVTTLEAVPTVEEDAVFEADGPGAVFAWLLAAWLGAGVTISNMASSWPSSRSGETEGRSPPSRTGLRREARALVLGGTDEAIIDDIDTDVPDSIEASSDALSEFIPAARPAAKSLTRCVGTCTQQ